MPDKSEERGRLHFEKAEALASLRKLPEAGSEANIGKAVFQNHSFDIHTVTPFLRVVETCQNISKRVGKQKNPNGIAIQRLTLADNFLHLHFYEGAAAEATAGLMQRKAHPSYLVALGAVHADALNQLGKYQEALKAIKEARVHLEKKPSFAEGLNRGERLTLDQLGPPPSSPREAPSKQRKKGQLTPKSSGKKLKSATKSKLRSP